MSISKLNVASMLAAAGVLFAISAPAKADCLSLCTEICMYNGGEVYPGCMGECFNSICIGKKKASYNLDFNSRKDNKSSNITYIKDKYSI